MTVDAREVVVFITRREDEFLVLHRRPSLGAFWHVVSGGLEGAESFEAAAVRELLEETGFDAAEGIARCPIVEFTYPSPWPREAPSFVSVRGFLLCVPADFEPELDWEHDAYRWCSFREATALLHWPSVREALARLAGTH